MLQFCPVCKNLLQLRNEGDKNIGFCKCGFVRTAGILLEADDNLSNKSKLGSGFVEEGEGQAGIDRICKKCGHNQAEVSEIASNETNIFIYKCLKCNHSEREVQGSSKF
jgi:DNA-directed RNA polymerase subunit M/transcription elongation factor TFIIS